MAANDKQVGGGHYAAPVQHWDMVVMHDLNYFEGQITKYVMRARKKNGIQDLEKARHFIDKYLEVYSSMTPMPPAMATPTPVTEQHTLTQYPDADFSIEGYSAQGQALYKCRGCGQEGWYATTQDAHQGHGGCAGRGYVQQG